MPKLIDISERRFGRLIVIERVSNNKHGKSRWLCECDCGKKILFVVETLEVAM